MNLLGLGLIFIVALLVLGPKQMQQLGHYLGKLTRKLGKLRANLQQEVEDKVGTSPKNNKE